MEEFNKMIIFIKEQELVKQWFWWYLLIINIVGFLIMGLDKFKAKKKFWRTPEKVLMTISLAGGGLGTLCGMYYFRHKTKKTRFAVGFPVIFVCELVLIIYAVFFVK